MTVDQRTLTEWSRQTERLLSTSSTTLDRCQNRYVNQFVHACVRVHTYAFVRLHSYAGTVVYTGHIVLYRVGLYGTVHCAYGAVYSLRHCTLCVWCCILLTALYTVRMVLYTPYGTVHCAYGAVYSLRHCTLCVWCCILLTALYTVRTYHLFCSCSRSLTDQSVSTMLPHPLLTPPPLLWLVCSTETLQLLSLQKIAL